MKNEENIEQKIQIFQDLIYIKTECILEEIQAKFELLSLINQNEDNSSELAGFEINKLLKEQSKLETNYNQLISKKSTLKSIKTKKEYQEIQVQIEDVSKSLKESTKKICRLFKENKNLNEDILKVKSEGDEAVMLMNTMLEKLKDGKFKDFEIEILNQLEGHNKLEEFQKQEKDLLTKIKKIRTFINQENLSYENELKEKNNTILNLKEELNKTQTENLVKLRYQIRELETFEATQERLYQQEENELIKDKKKYEEILNQEQVVFKRNEEYLQKENQRQKQTLQYWSKKLNQDREKMEKNLKEMQKLKEADMNRLKNLQKILNDAEKQEKEEEEKLKIVNKERERKIEEEQTKNDMIQLIQYHFENWYEKIGQFQKIKKGRKKKQLKSINSIVFIIYNHLILFEKSFNYSFIFFKLFIYQSCLLSKKQSSTQSKKKDNNKKLFQTKFLISNEVICGNNISNISKELYFIKFKQQFIPIIAKQNITIYPKLFLPPENPINIINIILIKLSQRNLIKFQIIKISGSIYQFYFILILNVSYNSLFLSSSNISYISLICIQKSQSIVFLSG